MGKYFIGCFLLVCAQALAQVTNISPHITPGEDPNAPEDTDMAADLVNILEALKADCASCDSYDKALALRAMLGTKGKQSELTARIQQGSEAGAINATTVAALGKLWQHCNRQVDKLLVKLAPTAEASFSDDDVEIERQPGEDDR